MLLLPSLAWPLEISEKLTLRILKVSGSKKTILINRGLEDGLEVGDHANFFMLKGVVARGVVAKASPTYSIWSIYRISHPSDLIANKVMNLKITPKATLSKDPTHALKAELPRISNVDIQEIDELIESSNNEFFV